MKEARLKKNRRCKDCNSLVYGSAERLIEHLEEHRLVKRMLDAGLVVPKEVQVKRAVKGGVLL